MRILLIAFCLIWLTGCALIPPSSPANNLFNPWRIRQQELTALTIWDADGVIALRSKEQNLSATLKWQQTHQEYLIRLFGPLGSYGYTLSGNSKGVSLATHEGKHFSAASPEILLSEQVGWRLPVSNLFYWIRGLPAPRLSYHANFDNYQRIQRLQQSGWIIYYSAYTAYQGVDLPIKIILESPALTIKIIIHQWHFPIDSRDHSQQNSGLNFGTK